MIYLFTLYQMAPLDYWRVLFAHYAPLLRAFFQGVLYGASVALVGVLVLLFLFCLIVCALCAGLLFAVGFLLFHAHRLRKRLRPRRSPGVFIKVQPFEIKTEGISTSLN